MKVTIVGCGWLGLPLGEQLVQKGFQVAGSTTQAAKLGLLETKGITAFQLNLANVVTGSEGWKVFFAADVLIINIPPGRAKPADLALFPHKVQLLVNAAFEQGMQKIIFTSTTGVYGAATGIVDESVSPQPDTASGKAVFEAEQWLLSQKNLQVSILRLAGLVGGERHPGRFLAGKKDIPNPEAPVNLVHREDVIAAITHLLENPFWGKIYNICADAHPTKQAYYSWAAAQSGLEQPSFRSESRGEDQKRIDNKLFKQEINFRYQYRDPFNFPL